MPLPSVRPELTVCQPPRPLSVRLRAWCAVAFSGSQLGFSCFFSYNNPNQAMVYQSYLTRIETVPNICESLSHNVIDTITGGIQGIGRGKPVYSVACGDPVDFAKQTDFTYLASHRDYDLTPNLGGQNARASRARAAVKGACENYWEHQQEDQEN
ncbi:hypothetical protein T492DRAFT_1140720 [Pavlovales sp. CCMP2436]|nr:hypothetical protein T492DRAFT_1140720 [Pavlovales sp. CCMP2436]|mmetsp:Transcript_48910/g.114601  ORF Transcript_48910/g.114601 Transcript_48910/m.114601 type:complete len:155 (+) Transcript_48910:106-570(+)